MAYDDYYRGQSWRDREQDRGWGQGREGGGYAGGYGYGGGREGIGYGGGFGQEHQGRERGYGAGQQGWGGQFGQGSYGQGGYGQYGQGGQGSYGGYQGGAYQGGYGGYGGAYGGGTGGYGTGGYGTGGYGTGGYGTTGYGGGFYGTGGYGQQGYQGGMSRAGYGERDFESRTGRESSTGGYGYGTGYGLTGTQRGQFFGRGPKGYRRSDERIREDVNEELTRHPEVDASEIEVRVENGEVTLTGMVEDRHQKRLAEDLTERVSGVTDVHNQLRARHGLGEKIREMFTGEHGGETRERAGRTTGA